MNIPFILLGGGGYTVKNASRTWAYETACALGIENDIDLNLPWNEFFDWFGPRYRLEVAGNNMEDMNLKDGSLDRVRWVTNPCSCVFSQSRIERRLYNSFLSYRLLPQWVCMMFRERASDSISGS
jgi:hypothetical protein